MLRKQGKSVPRVVFGGAISGNSVQFVPQIGVRIPKGRERRRLVISAEA